jgi:hypothetical protein
MDELAPPPARTLRRTIAQRGMEARPVIVLLNEDLDVAAQMPEVPIVVRVDFLPLQGFHKTPAAGVIGVGRMFGEDFAASRQIIIFWLRAIRETN